MTPEELEQIRRELRERTEKAAAAKRQNSRAAVLLRLYPGLLERLDSLAESKRTNRHALIVELLEIALQSA
jgi:hypothetical protein